MTTVIATDKFVSVDRLLSKDLLSSMRFKDGDKFITSKDGRFTLVGSGASIDDQQLHAFNSYIIPALINLIGQFYQSNTVCIGDMIKNLFDISKLDDSELNMILSHIDGLHQKISFKDKNTIFIVTSEGVFAVITSDPDDVNSKNYVNNKQFDFTKVERGEISILGSGREAASMSYTLHDDPIDDDGIRSCYKVISNVDTLTSSKVDIIRPENHSPLIKEVL
jgi:hypothetical protein